MSVSDIKQQHLRTYVSGHGGDGLTVGHNDFRSLF